MIKQEKESTGEIIQFINFRLGQEEFGVDINSVREIIRVADITKIPDAPSFIYGMTNLRGQIIPVIDLAKKFGQALQDDLPETARIVVAEINGQTTGMLVYEVPGVLKIKNDNIEPAPELIQSEAKKDYIRGIGKLDNRIIILLDLEKLLTPCEQNVEESATAGISSK